MKKIVLIAFLLFSPLVAQHQHTEWGWQGHRYINEHAVDYLPPEMDFFQAKRSFLRDHAVDPDTDPQPGFYHYIDIDYYPEFFSGTLPHNMDSLVALYNLSIVEGNGTVPWVIDEWTDSLTALMAAKQWDDAWQVAAELGHYVADASQPLHLTLNYNGQLTGNNGIHSRYETNMVNQNLSQMALPAGMGRHWENVLDSVFYYIGEIYPYVDSIMIADDLARSQDPGFGSTYYDIMWQELEQLTIISMHYSILNLASIWRTAWENANDPDPLGLSLEDYQAMGYLLADAYPNPFNPTTNIEFSIPKSAKVTLQILNPLGQTVATLASENLAAGTHKYTWHAANVSSGIYFYRLHVGKKFVQTKKMVLVR